MSSLSSYSQSEEIDWNEEIAVQTNLTFGAHIDREITVRERITNYYETNNDQLSFDELSNESYIDNNDKAVQTEPKTLMLEKCTQTKSIDEILNEHIKTVPEPMDISVTAEQNTIHPSNETEKTLEKSKKRKQNQQNMFKRKKTTKNLLTGDMKRAPRLLIVKENLSRYNPQEILQLRSILDNAVLTQSHPFFIPQMAEGNVVIDETACEIVCFTNKTLNWLLSIKLDLLNGIELKVIRIQDYPVTTILIDIPGIHRNINDVKNTIFNQNCGFGLRFQTWFMAYFEKHSYGMTISFKINRDDVRILRNFRKSCFLYGSRIVPFHFC